MTFRCQVVKASPKERRSFNHQGFLSHPAISAATCEARGLHMQALTLPPGIRGLAHKHVAHETAIYQVSGESGVWWGFGLENYDLLSPGDFLYIPADMPHLPINPTDQPATVVVARTDPNDPESTVFLPELDRLPPR